MQWSSYFERSRQDPSLVGDRWRMVACYLEDMKKATSKFSMSTIPEHIPWAEQSAPTSQTCRLLQWNVNNLCGPETASPQDPAEVMKLIDLLKPDVLALQETMLEPAPWYRGPDPDACVHAVSQLDGLLRAQGFDLYRTNGLCPSMLAVRGELSVDATGGSFDPSADHPRFPDFQHEVTPARYVSVSTATGPHLGFLVNHLYHDNNGGKDPLPIHAGVRKHQAQRVVEHLATNVTNVAGVVWATDFNQAREADKNMDDWAVVTSALNAIGQPVDDGVAALLSRHGFACAYDKATLNNFGEGSAQGATRAPQLTHWSHTTVDFPYLQSQGAAAFRGVYVIPSVLSDHLPIVTDIALTSE